MFADDFKLPVEPGSALIPSLLTVGRAGPGRAAGRRRLHHRAAGDANRDADQPKPQAGDYARGRPGVEKICIRHHKL
jgi:hypothetical protein